MQLRSGPEFPPTTSAAWSARARPATLARARQRGRQRPLALTIARPARHLAQQPGIGAAPLRQRCWRGQTGGIGPMPSQHCLTRSRRRSQAHCPSQPPPAAPRSADWPLRNRRSRRSGEPVSLHGRAGSPRPQVREANRSPGAPASSARPVSRTSPPARSRAASDRAAPLRLRPRWQTRRNWRPARRSRCHGARHRWRLARRCASPAGAHRRAVRWPRQRSPCAGSGPDDHHPEFRIARRLPDECAAPRCAVPGRPSPGARLPLAPSQCPIPATS